MAAGIISDRHGILVITDGLDPHIRCFPFPAVQLYGLVREPCHFPYLLLSLGIIQDERAVQVVKLRPALQLSRFFPQRFHVLGPFHVILDLKDLVKYLIRERIQARQLRYTS